MKEYEVVITDNALAHMPLRVQLMNSEPERTQGLRSLVVDNYSVIFVVRDTQVMVVRVMYSASDISARLAAEGW